MYLWEKKKPSNTIDLPSNVKVLYQEDKWIPIIDSYFVRKSPEKFKENTYAYRFKKGKKYSCVFGLGQIGAYIAHLISGRNRSPLILFNDEFPSCWRQSSWTDLEKKAAADSELIVVPDADRSQHLLKEYGLSAHATSVLPNIAEVKQNLVKINWHERLRIPSGKKICLNAGTLSDFAQFPEILSGINNWPDDFVLVLNDRSAGRMAEVKKSYSHLDIPGKIFWISDSLTEDEINSLVSHSYLNFALYRNTGPNIEYIGFSSGKLMRSIALGSPVIASDLISLQFVKESGLGVLIKHPSEIPNAIKQVDASRNKYSANCIKFFNEQCNFNLYWNKFISDVKKNTGIDFSG